jgi:hypothetical protein
MILILKNKLKALATVTVITLAFLGQQPALACLSCGCGTSGASTDLGALGGASAIFAKDKKFLFQFGNSVRNINGSFNETGVWNTRPVDSQLLTFQNAIGLMYFPTQEISFGVTVPVVSNYLNRATWGSFGSIAPTDSTKASFGLALGDIGAQVTYKFLEIDDLAFAGWLQSEFPTGQINGNPENVSGSGLFKLMGGVFGIKKIGNFEILGNLGYQQPLSKVESNTIGSALLYQLQSNYQLTNDLKMGLGVNGFWGSWSMVGHTMPSTKVKFMVTGQYDLSIYNGIGVGLGYDPHFFGQNSTTDLSFNLVFYQFI